MGTPYIVGPPILKPENYYGYRKAVARFFEIVAGRQVHSLSVQGLRRSGKTSFLYHVMHEDVLSQHVADPGQYLMIHIDMSVCESPAHFCEQVLDGLRIRLGQIETQVSTLPACLDSVRSLLRRVSGQRVVFLLDELDRLKQGPFDQRFLTQLRAMASDLHYELGFVTASYRSLRDIGSGFGLPWTSPFYNIFYPEPLYLSGLEMAEIEALICEPAESEGITVPDDSVWAIHHLAGSLPFLLQATAAAWYLDQRGNQLYDPEKARAQLVSSMSQHFQYWWQPLDDQEKESLLAIAGHGSIDRIEDTVPPASPEVIRRLKNYGLIVEKGRSWRTNGELFSTWLCQQMDSGVATHGPVLPRSLTPNPAQPSLPVKPTTSSATVTWLHLSDLHFRTGEKDTWDENIVLHALLEDVQSCMTQQELAPDLILVSGDVGFSGIAPEYELARHFLERLRATTRLGKDRLFVVPGNHDVDRTRIGRGTQLICDSLKDRDVTNAVLLNPDEWRLVLARLAGYGTFVNDYLGPHFTFDDEHYFYVRSLDLAGQRIAIVGLNSAWLSASDEDKATGLLIGERQARMAADAARVAGANLTIALLHHPLDCLREFDRNDSGALLLGNCQFIVHGHMRETTITELSGPDSRAMILGTGADDPARACTNRYNWVKLDLATATGTVYLRRYSDKRNGFWASDTLSYRNTPKGIWRFHLPTCLQAHV